MFVDLEKAYDRVDKIALWTVLEIYSIGGLLLKRIYRHFIERGMHV